MSKEIRIVPAILTDDPRALETMVRQTETFTSYTQFDIMDGQFVPSRSVTCDDIIALKTRLKFEAHLMALHPESCIDDFSRAGAQKIVFHSEATDSPGEIILQVKELGMKVGLALNPGTPIATITPFIKEADSVLFLSVNPGFYGSKFMPEVLDKIAAFRRTQPDMEIGIDGGIKESNIINVARSGVDVIYVGSAIFLQAQPTECYRRLQTLVKTII